jgi:hypothetical protein
MTTKHGKFFFLFLVAAMRWGLGATDHRQQSRDHPHLPDLPTETLHATERNQGLGKGSISAKEGMIVIVVVILLQQLRHPVTEIRQCTAGLLLHQVRHGTP